MVTSEEGKSHHHKKRGYKLIKDEKYRKRENIWRYKLIKDEKY